MSLPSILPTLRGSRITLRPAEDRDLEALFAVYADPEVMRYWSTTAWTEREQARAHLERDRARLAEGSAWRWMIADPGDVVVGCVALFSHDAVSRRAELGYLLGRHAWGRGYATEALRLALNHAFGALGLNRLEADTDPRNTGSTRLLERVGFHREGLLRERWIVDGEVSDTALYGMLSRDART